MPSAKATPVVIGVGDFKNRSLEVKDAVEPMQLMLQAVLLAIADTNISSSAAKELQANIDSISVVATWTWNYPDLPGLLGEQLGVNPRHKVLSEHGGNSPGQLFDEAARRISLGNHKVAILTGGEALASLAACAAAKALPPSGWTSPDPNAASISASDISALGKTVGTVHSVGLPIHVYPLYENGFRAHRGQSIQENNQESARLYANFAAVAERNPFAWNYGQPAASEETIGTITRRNRMVCFPYPLLMNAFNTINLAGACILTSTEYARELGVPESKWIYPLGGAGTADSDNFWERPNFYSSPSISRSLDAALDISGLKKEEIDFFDFYSCFPIVPKLACQHLGLPILGSSKPITLLGGLTSFGGAGNNYAMHSFTAMVRELRKCNDKHGLVLANGGMLTHQYAVCLSTNPRKEDSAYPDQNPLPHTVTDVPVPPFADKAEGEAIIEAYTVQFNRDGTPLLGHVVGRLKGNGHRFLANHGDSSTLHQMSSGFQEPIGRGGWVQGGGDDRNLFTFEKVGKL